MKGRNVQSSRDFWKFLGTKLNRCLKRSQLRSKKSEFSNRDETSFGLLTGKLSLLNFTSFMDRSLAGALCVWLLAPNTTAPPLASMRIKRSMSVIQPATWKYMRWIWNCFQATISWFKTRISINASADTEINLPRLYGSSAVLCLQYRTTRYVLAELCSPSKCNDADQYESGMSAFFPNRILIRPVFSKWHKLRTRQIKLDTK